MWGRNPRRTGRIILQDHVPPRPGWYDVPLGGGTQEWAQALAQRAADALETSGGDRPTAQDVHGLAHQLLDLSRAIPADGTVRAGAWIPQDALRVTAWMSVRLLVPDAHAEAGREAFRPLAADAAMPGTRFLHRVVEDVDDLPVGPALQVRAMCEDERDGAVSELLEYLVFPPECDEGARYVFGGVALERGEELAREARTMMEQLRLETGTP